VESPSVAPGYSRNRALSAADLDEEGVHRFGDAMRFALRSDPAAGLVFDGRPAESFKLASGSRVAVGPLGAGSPAISRPMPPGPPDRDRA
jgi:feruloyl-CoA synthase